MIYALVLILASDPIPRVSWYGSIEDCRQHYAVQAFHHQTRGATIEWSACQAVDARSHRFTRGETFVPRMDGVPAQ